jgi:hypothetical protein
MMLHEGDPDYFKSGPGPVCIIDFFMACPFWVMGQFGILAELIVLRCYNQAIMKEERLL